MKKISRLITSKIQAQFKSLLALFLLRKILAENKNKVVVLCGAVGIGDMLIQTTYLDSWCQRNDRVHEDMLIVCHAPQETVVHEMGYEQTLGLSREWIIKLELLGRSIFRSYCDYQVAEGRLLVVDPWFYIRTVMCQYIEGLTVLHIVRDTALQLYDYPYVQTFPSVSADYMPVAKSLGIEKPFVILNPYSNSMNLDLEPFAMVAKALSQAGIHVYSNVVGNQEPVEGSVPLKCGVHELYALSGGAEAVVSIRSGILDYCIANMKKVFCLYDRWRGRIYTLKAWDTDAEIYEYRYGGEQDAQRIADEIVGKILEDYQKENLPKG